jgi:hypothetical protein
MDMSLLFYILAVICFGIATVVGERVKPVNLIALGLAFFALGHVI